MIYFDAKLLRQYLDQKQKLMVYDDTNWYEVATMSDLSDDITGIAYTNIGQPKYIDYTNISKIKVGNRVYTLDQLQQRYDPTNAKPDAEPKESEPELNQDWFSPIYDIGKRLLKEKKR